MDTNKGRHKNSRKCYKKTTRFLKTMQKHTIPNNYHSRTQKLVHQSIQIANLQTEKYPALYPFNPESCKYYILKKRFAVKQHKLCKNGECASNSQVQVRKCKQTDIDRFFITPSNYTSEIDGFNKFLKEKCRTDKIKSYSRTYPNAQVAVVDEKLLHTSSFKSEVSTNQSKENVCIMNNELNQGLLFQCSDASLQLKQPIITKTKKINFNEDYNSKETNNNMKQNENYNNINYILPKLMQQITVYKMLENLREHSNQSDNEDNMYSSMSTCSSSSSTREYYLPALSCSTDTMHVANLLANERLVESSIPSREIISNEQNNNQGICKNTYNKNKSNLSPAYQQASLKNEMLPSNSIGMKEVGLDELKKSSHKIINMLKHNNDGLLPFYPFANFNSLLIKNKSSVIKNYDQSSIGVQTQENEIDEKDEDDSITFKGVKNKRIKLTKENFIVNNNAKNDESLNKKNPSNSLSLVSNENCEKFINNFSKANKEAIRILNEHVHETHLQATDKEKPSLNHNGSNSNLSNISMSKPKNRSISEDVLTTIKGKGDEMYQTKRPMHKPKSSLCFSNKISESSELPLYFKSYTNDSHDSLNVSKPYFVKLNPFFDASFQDPKISRLILSSKTLAGESDSTIDKANIHSEFTANTKVVAEKRSKEKCVYSAKMSKMATRSPINGNKLEVKHGCTSNRSVFAADSIIYGSNAFQKIREKFGLVKNKMKTNKERKQFQAQGLSRKQGVFNPKHLREESFECFNKGKDNSQSVGSNINMDMTVLHNNFLTNETLKNVSMDSFENEGFYDKKKYLLLLPKKSDISDYQSAHSMNVLSYIDEKARTISFSNIHGKSVDISIMDDEHELININLKSNSSKGLKAPSEKSEIKNLEKETMDTKYMSEKETQVNMYLVESSKIHTGDAISNKMPVSENDKTSMVSSGSLVQALDERSKAAVATVSSHSQTKTMMLDYNDKAESKISNKNGEAESTQPNDNGQAEATMLNNYGQPIILYNSSGYPITDLNGRILKNNLGAYLLNSDKYADVITKKLPVFDCDLMSVSNSSFNPTKVPFVKSQLKITDRCGNPVSLFNNLGWPLTNEEGFFLHDNKGKLLVALDSFNFPLSCSNGSPIYLQNGAMLLSQKYKFIVTKRGSNSNCAIRSLKIERRHENDKAICYNKKDNKISHVMPMNRSKTIRTLNKSNPYDFKSYSYQKPKRKPNFKSDLFLPTEVPELMHELFDYKARPRFSNLRNQGSIPQSPIPIFDRAGNKLTDEYGFPLQNKYGEYMLLLDKNGIALSDSCGGPIFDSNGKQLWLKDLYYMKKHPYNYFYDRYMPPEHPYIDTSTSNNDQNSYDSSDELIPLLDLKFENEQSSEPIMNYIKENNVKAYDIGVKQLHFLRNKSCPVNRKPKLTNFFKNASLPTNEKYYLQPPMATIKENVLLYETRSYQEEDKYGYLNGPFSQQNHDNNVPYSYEQSVYEDNALSEQLQLDNLEQYGNNYYYHEQGFPENYEFHQDAEIQYYVDENNYVMYY